MSSDGSSNGLAASAYSLPLLVTCAAEILPFTTLSVASSGSAAISFGLAFIILLFRSFAGALIILSFISSAGASIISLTNALNSTSFLLLIILIRGIVFTI